MNKGQIFSIILFAIVYYVLTRPRMDVFFQVKRKRLLKNTTTFDTKSSKINIPKLNIARKKRLKKEKRVNTDI